MVIVPTFRITSRDRALAQHMCALLLLSSHITLELLVPFIAQQTTEPCASKSPDYLMCMCTCMIKMANYNNALAL